MELEISTSSNDVFLYPSVALDDPTAAPDPSLTVTEWSAVSGNKAAFLMANIKLTIPPKTKPPEKLLALSLTVNATEFMAVSCKSWRGLVDRQEHRVQGSCNH